MRECVRGGVGLISGGAAKEPKKKTTTNKQQICWSGYLEKVGQRRRERGKLYTMYNCKCVNFYSGRRFER